MKTIHFILVESLNINSSVFYDSLLFNVKIYLKHCRYADDKQQLESLTNEVTKIKWLRIFILVLQMAPVLRFVDALV